MCLILFAYKIHPQYKLIVAANRDEFYQRPTAPATFWKDKPTILAGRDLKAGGTWMGVNTNGKIGMLTNYRDLSNIMPEAPTRGHLVSDFLQSGKDARSYLQKISEKGHRYNGFNIICGDVEELYYYGNYDNGIQKIDPGYHGLSNALLDTQWPKINKGIDKLKLILRDDHPLPLVILEALYDDVKAPAHLLPDTGVGPEMEHMLSPMFIKSPEYGSRCSTVLMVNHNNDLQFLERTYNVDDYSFTDINYTLHTER